MQICRNTHRFAPMGVQAAVLGASGYAGGELLRYLAVHPAIDVVAVAAGAKKGLPVSDVLPHIVGIDLELQGIAGVLEAPADVVFSCLPPGELPDVGGERCVVDLSDDHRADETWTYGLPEFDRDRVATATSIANPGCYPTATLLCLVPFVASGAIEGPVVVDALSGTSGAGRRSEDHLLHASLESSATAYGSVSHRHVPEMERGLASFGGRGLTVSFTPHLVPMSRGLLVTARAPLSRDIDDAGALEILSDTYSNEPFVSVIESWPATKSVAGSNRAVVAARVDGRAGMLVCSAVIDNLGKGAAGQAVQNANLALGLGETTGLETMGVWP